MQRPPLGEVATMDNNNSNNNTMNQLLQSCAALHAVSSNNSAAFTLQTNNGNSTLLPLQPRKLQPNESNNNNDDEVNDENAGPLRQAVNTNTTKVELRADLNQLAALRRTRAPTMSRRNERERNRVRYLNFTFDVLRQHLPRERAKGKAKKMSKVDTLRGAIDYIRDLQDVLGVDGLPKGSPSSHTPGDASAGSFAGTESESDSLSPRGSPEYSGGSPDDGEVMSDQEDELAHHLAGWFC